MKNLRKKIASFIVKITFTIFTLSVVFFFYYLNTGAIDVQIIREEKIYRQLRQRCINARIKDIEYKISRENERVKLIPVRLTMIDELRTEIDEILQEKNLNIESVKHYNYINRNKFTHDDKGYLFEKSEIIYRNSPSDRKLIEKIERFNNVKESEHKSQSDLLDFFVEEERKNIGTPGKVPIIKHNFTTSQIHRLKIQYLKDLKETNRILAREIMTETLSPGVKKRRLKKLKVLKNKYDEMRNPICLKGRERNLGEEIISYRIQLELLQKYKEEKNKKK